MSKVEAFCRRHALLSGGEKVLVAVSGGMDSTVLLDVLFELSKTFSLRLELAHVNYGLRGAESDRDEALVRSLATSLGLPCHVLDLRGKGWKREGESVQQSARGERYRYFQLLRSKLGAERIALGHHRQDQAETVLFNIIRGAGLEGLCGMWPLSGEGLIRPFLDTDRNELLEYAKSRGVTWVEDSSNASLRYTRNFIRHEVIPGLATLNPGVDRALVRLAAVAHQQTRLLDRTLQELMSSGLVRHEDASFILNRDAVLSLPEALQTALLRRLWEQARATFMPQSREVELSYHHIPLCLALIARESGVGHAELPGRVHVWLQGAEFRLGVPRALEASPGESRVLDQPGELELPSGGTLLLESARPEEVAWNTLTPSEAYLDAECVELPLTIRYYLRGDRFHPLGSPAETLLREFFSRQKIPAARRPFIPLVVSGEHIVWVAGYRIAHFARATSATRTLWKLTLRRRELDLTGKRPCIESDGA